MYTHHVSPYDGGIFHQAPLFLPLFSLLPKQPLAISLLYIFVDLLSATALMSIADTGESGSSKLFTSPRKKSRWSSLAVAAAFLFNPFSIATCVARPTSVFTNCAILYAIERAVTGNALTSMFALSLASYLSLYPVLLFPPLILLSFDWRKSDSVKQSLPLFTLTNIFIFFLSLAGLLYLSYLITGGSWEFIRSTYGVQLLLPDLTPNVGLWWYFFIEMFDSFREFFLGVFWLHLFGYVGGLCIKLRYV